MPDHGSFRSADQPEERRVREDHRPLVVASANHDGVAGRIEGVAQELSLLFAAVHLGGLPDEDRDLRRSRVGRAGDELEAWGPLGNGFSTTPVDHLVMVAGGIGQTPFLALGREFLGGRRYGSPPRPVQPARRVTLCYDPAKRIKLEFQKTEGARTLLLD